MKASCRIGSVIGYFSHDHKVIGIQYGVLSLLVLCIAGLFAMIFRSELLETGMQFLDPTMYNTLDEPARHRDDHGHLAGHRRDDELSGSAHDRRQ